MKCAALATCLYQLSTSGNKVHTPRDSMGRFHTKLQVLHHTIPNKGNEGRRAFQIRPRTMASFSYRIGDTTSLETW